MHDALPVRGIERRCDLDRVAEDLIDRQRAFRHTRRQRLALEEFHDEILDAVLLPDVEQWTNVRMRER